MDEICDHVFTVRAMGEIRFCHKCGYDDSPRSWTPTQIKEELLAPLEARVTKLEKKTGVEVMNQPATEVMIYFELIEDDDEYHGVFQTEEEAISHIAQQPLHDAAQRFFRIVKKYRLTTRDE